MKIAIQQEPGAEGAELANAAQRALHNAGFNVTIRRCEPVCAAAVRNVSACDGAETLISRLRQAAHALEVKAVEADGETEMQDIYRDIDRELRAIEDSIGATAIYRMIGGPHDGQRRLLPLVPPPFVYDSSSNYDNGYRLLACSRVMIHSSVGDASITVAPPQPKLDRE